MCINKETSIGSFTLCFVLSSFMLFRGIKNKNKTDIITGSLFISVSFIQLLEYFIWKNQECNNINSVFSILIIVLLLCQIIVFYISVLSQYKIKDITIHSAMFLAIIVFIYSIIILIKNKEKLCSKPSKNSCRLEWDSMKYLYKNNKIITFIGGIFIFIYVV